MAKIVFSRAQIKDLEAAVLATVATEPDGIGAAKLISGVLHVAGIPFSKSALREGKRVLNDLPGITVANGVVLPQLPELVDGDCFANSVETRLQLQADCPEEPAAPKPVDKANRPPEISLQIGPNGVGDSSAITIDKITGLLSSNWGQYVEPSTQLYKDTLACKNATGVGVFCPKPSFDGIIDQPIPAGNLVTVAFRAATNEVITLSGPAVPRKKASSFSIPIDMKTINKLGLGPHFATANVVNANGIRGSAEMTFYVALPPGLTVGAL
jgi:hypothetical protein